MSATMPSLIILFLALGCVTSESRHRHLRSDPEAFEQPDFGFTPDSREARDFVRNPYLQPTKYSAPAKFYNSQQQNSRPSYSPYSSSASQYSQPSKPYLTSSYFPQEAYENSPQPQSSFSQVSYGKNPQPQSSFPQMTYKNSPQPQSSFPQVSYKNNPQPQSYFPQASYENSPQPQSSFPETVYKNSPQPQSAFPQVSYENSPLPQSAFPQSSYENNPQPQTSYQSDPEPIYSPVVAYDVSKRRSANYGTKAARRLVQTQPSLLHTPSVTRFTSPAQKAYVAPIAIVKQTRDDQYDGTFSFGFEGANGIASSANGYVKSISPKEQAQVMQGTYSYTAPDGTPVTTRWFADETGFHAEGAHLPVAPRPY